ncbi:MAG: hypothetical protein J0I07_06320, partial [Myxococcales bacterium]|nr:hypothetical protein [Myxococcales bacterium]
LDVALMPDLAFNIVLPIFAAAIVGGLGHAYGAIVGGFLIVTAKDLEQAAELAKGCPIFEAGGRVEVRAIVETHA